MNDEEKQNYSYLGDGVYAYFDGYGVWLRTGHHEESRCDDNIYLEPSVMSKLNLFADRVYERSVGDE